MKPRGLGMGGWCLHLCNGDRRVSPTERYHQDEGTWSPYLVLNNLSKCRSQFQKESLMIHRDGKVTANLRTGLTHLGGRQWAARSWKCGSVRTEQHFLLKLPARNPNTPMLIRICPHLCFSHCSLNLSKFQSWYSIWWKGKHAQQSTHRTVRYEHS